ncbi:hypothetical protein JCM8547_007278 [Rhodosporidiobolus lusitaniae]
MASIYVPTTRPPSEPTAGPSSFAAHTAEGAAGTLNGAGATPPAFAAHLLPLYDLSHASPLSGTQDLISLFHLDPLYNTFLRPYLDPSLTSAGTGGSSSALPLVGAADNPAASPAPGSGGEAGAAGVVVGKIDLKKGKGKAAAAPPAAAASPAPQPPVVGSPAPGALKIMLGGIKFGSARGGGSPSPSPSVGPDGGATGAARAAAAVAKPAKRLKMEKGFEWMVGDVLGIPPVNKRNPHPNFLQHLVLNPDPAPCPPLHPLDASQLREAFTLERGGLAGFDMGVWEGRPAAGAFGQVEVKKKKKKRKPDQQGQQHGGNDPKKQRH